jgi:hypothetical protein
MSDMSQRLDMAVGRPRGRRNELKQIGEITLLPVHLPRGFYDLISTYSDTTGRSSGETLSRFLESGFLTYLQGQNTLLETIRSLQTERAKT